MVVVSSVNPPLTQKIREVSGHEHKELKKDYNSLETVHRQLNKERDGVSSHNTSSNEAEEDSDCTMAGGLNTIA